MRNSSISAWKSFVCRFRIFSLLKAILTILFTTTSWSQTNNTVPINVLLGRLIEENGGKTNALPPFKGSATAFREIKKDDEGAQVFFAGDQMSPLLAMFKSIYGEPAYVRTNISGLTMFQYTKTAIGVGLSCSRATSATETITHLIILGPKGLASLRSGTFSKDDERDEAVSDDERHACDVAIKTAIDRGCKGKLDGMAIHGTVGWVVNVFEKSKGPIRGSVATVGLKNDFRVVYFERAEKAPKP